jgi:ADP-ribose pyrophosphatase YjhB (NUDIX family)
MSEAIGVLYAPFQFASIGEPHSSTLTKMWPIHQYIVIALPVRRVSPTKNAPLDYGTREAMIRQYLGSMTRYVHVVPVPDKKYPKDKVAALENAVRSLFSNLTSVCVYSDPSFAAVYKANGGVWAVRSEGRGYEAAEAIARKNTVQGGIHTETTFRQGIIFGMLNQFPISWPTVDMAIRRVVQYERLDTPVVPPKVFYLFGKKPGEFGWRFPGGFKDREDPNFETAVLREAGEEVLKKGVEPKTVFEKPRYISSRNINDWRYKGEIDGITTLFYMVNFIGTEDQIKAGDDLADTKWMTLDQVNPEEIEGEHIYLYQDLCEYEKEHTGPQHCNRCNTMLTCDCGIVPEGTHQVYMEDCWTCNGTGKTGSAHQMGVLVTCKRCCGISKPKGMAAK